MTIKIFVFNAITQETIIDSAITVTVDETFETAQANHQFFKELYPDCNVNFVIDQDNFIFGMPLNMEKDEQAYDEGRMTWEQYSNKWYRGALESDSDMRDTIDYEIDRLEVQDFASRDSVCY